MTGVMIDAHHHVWRLAETPWLNGPPQPRIFGDYEAIRRDYPIEEYLADARAAGVVRARPAAFLRNRFAACPAHFCSTWIIGLTGILSCHTPLRIVE